MPTAITRALGSIRLAGWSLKWKLIVAAVAVVLGIAGAGSFFVVTGLSAAFQAREDFRVLEEELSDKGFADFTNANLYGSLAEHFEAAEHSAARAKSRLWFIGLLTWVPVVGERIEESRIQLDIAHVLARAGSGLAGAYRDAFTLQNSGDQSPNTQASLAISEQVTQALEQAAPVLDQVKRDLEKARQLRGRLGPESLDSRYASLLDRYLPQLQTFTYISRDRPSVIGRVFQLNLELSEVSDLVADPLEVLVGTSGVNDTFSKIIEDSRELSLELQLLERETREKFFGSEETRRDILETIRLMERGSRLLEQSTIGAQGLLGLARAMEDHGLFSKDFGSAARTSLEQAGSGLAFAQAEATALRSLLDLQSDGGREPQTALGFGAAVNLTPRSLDQIDQVLERASASTRFLKGFLGFQGPRSYLLLAQNQQEIRASGGFIGSVILVKLDQGELIDLVFQDSTTVDFLPPAYPNNPPPPQPIYWYLWMERLLFRDANWSPDFPTSAALVADIYRLGQGVQLDGVITGSKKLLVDMVELIGDIRVPDLPEPLTRETTQAYTDGALPYECSERHASTRGKRCFDEDAFFSIKDRLTSPVSTQERISVIDYLRTELGKRNIMAHIFDSNEGALLWDLGWNGAIPPVDHDYLSVVDSSLPGHTTEDVFRTWNYQVSLRVDRPLESRFWVRYDHQGEVRDDKVCRQSEPGSSNCYWNYFRIYFPAVADNIVAPPVPLNQGAEKLIWGYPDPDSLSLGLSTDVGPAPLTEIGGFIAVAPDSVMTVPLSYQLPWKTVRALGGNNYEYRLLLQKQPGIDTDLIEVALELPPASEVINASPAPIAQNGNWLSFKFELDADTQVVVSFRTPDGN